MSVPTSTADRPTPSREATARSDVLELFHPVVGDWFRARCEGKSFAIEPLKGHRKTQTSVVIDGATSTLITPYVEGTEMHARFASGAASYVLGLRWTKGPKPAGAGSFEATK